YLNSYSSGLPAAKLIIRGPSIGSSAAVIDRQDGVNEVIWLDGMRDVRVLNLKLVRGGIGAKIIGTPSTDSPGMEISGCDISQSGSPYLQGNGIYVLYATNVIINSNVCHDSSNGNGIWLQAAAGLTNNQCYGNGRDGISAA